MKTGMDRNMTLEMPREKESGLSTAKGNPGLKKETALWRVKTLKKLEFYGTISFLSVRGQKSVLTDSPNIISLKTLSKNRLQSLCQCIFLCLCLFQILTKGRKVGLDLRLRTGRANHNRSAAFQCVNQNIRGRKTGLFWLRIVRNLLYLVSGKLGRRVVTPYDSWI